MTCRHLSFEGMFIRWQCHRRSSSVHGSIDYFFFFLADFDSGGEKKKMLDLHDAASGEGGKSYLLQYVSFSALLCLSIWH